MYEFTGINPHVMTTSPNHRPCRYSPVWVDLLAVETIGQPGDPDPFYRDKPVTQVTLTGGRIVYLKHDPRDVAEIVDGFHRDDRARLHGEFSAEEFERAAREAETLVKQTDPREAVRRGIRVANTRTLAGIGDRDRQILEDQIVAELVRQDVDNIIGPPEHATAGYPTYHPPGSAPVIQDAETVEEPIRPPRYGTPEVSDPDPAEPTDDLDDSSAFDGHGGPW